MAIDDKAGGEHAPQVLIQGSGAEDDDGQQETSYKDPSNSNARWLRKRLGAQRRTPKLCCLLESLMKAEETEAETEVGAILEDIWKILLHCDKSGKDALRNKFKEHRKKRKQKEKRRHKKQRRKIRRPENPPKRVRGGESCPALTHRRPTTAATTATQTHRPPGVQAHSRGPQRIRRAGVRQRLRTFRILNGSTVRGISRVLFCNPGTRFKTMPV